MPVLNEYCDVETTVCSHLGPVTQPAASHPSSWFLEPNFLFVALNTLWSETNSTAASCRRKRFWLSVEAQVEKRCTQRTVNHGGNVHKNPRSTDIISTLIFSSADEHPEREEEFKFSIITFWWWHIKTCSAAVMCLKLRVNVWCPQILFILLLLLWVSTSQRMSQTPRNLKSVAPSQLQVFSDCICTTISVCYYILSGCECLHVSVPVCLLH